ncbi:hypothetical protein [Microbacterium sp. Root280D1]|uniref:hypothetical protein n=1 Tax=Microbacterium sp. Root280D1 TaxID=1736510 RepID=UPI0006FFEF91|nr:hypothetical protein [Microbacterium sp. Root280D1]KRD51938.1 hypothetical protein ASE34_08455 [Microbacterium sp. Root280D1]
MTSVEDLYLNVIKDGITRHPRSLQKRIGPSEMGKPCDRWILHKLNGDGEPDRGPAWKPAIGTAVHDQLECWFDAANRGGGEVERTEWITEWEVTVGQIGGQSITGHSDLFHVPTGTVIDHKIIGPKQLSKYRLHGPSEQYRVQAHLYGKGFTDDGGWGPCRAVAIAFLPRDGELSNAYFWSEPYNPHLAGQALLRSNRLHTMLTVVGIDAALAASPLCDDQWCTWCRAEKRAQDRAARASLFDIGELHVVSTPAPPAPLRALPSVPAPAHVAQLCDVCGLPLAPSVAADGHTIHPSCIPAFPPAPRPVPASPQPVAIAPVINMFDR